MACNFLYFHCPCHILVFRYQVYPCCSVSCVRLCDPMDCSMPGFSALHHLLELAQTLVHWVGLNGHLILCHHLLLPSIFHSIRVFSNELALHITWPKYWSFEVILISIKIKIRISRIRISIKRGEEHSSLSTPNLWVRLELFVSYMYSRIQ